MKKKIESWKQKCIEWIGLWKQKCKEKFQDKALPLLKRIHPVYGLICLVCVICLIGGLVSIAVRKSRQQQSQEDFQGLAENVIERVPSDQDEEPESDVDDEGDEGVIEEESGYKPKIELPVDPYERKLDFDKMQKEENADIYAWIYIPGTMIDYPIFQHPTDNTYYLNHNMNGSEGYPGCIYTENYNSKDFRDPNTVIYGHNMQNGTMFGEIHNFMSKDYVDQNPYVYIYTKEEMYVYQVFAAYEYGDDHLLADKDFSTENYLSTYISQIERSAGSSGILNSEKEPEGDGRILTLSTCISGQEEKRLLLQAALCDEIFENTY